ncbi:hypothetical protein L204_103006 [Cryptococcus depauperatus]|nr:hypothetical protein L204_00250 [Cryptococcus depauperatus CBS 7855]
MSSFERSECIENTKDSSLMPPAQRPFSLHSCSPLPQTPRTPYPPPPSQMSTPLGSYLSLKPRILLTFFSPCLLPMILTIAHLIQNRSSSSFLAVSLKASLLSACSGLAKGAASVQSMPRYLAMQTNQGAVQATQASILAVGAMLMDAIIIVEVVVNFIVDTYRSMLLCTIELAVRGTLEILIATTQNISDAITNSLNTIRSNIQNDISAANNVIQTAVGGINKVTSLVNVNLSVPEFTIPSLKFLANVTIPTGFEDGLIKLNTTLPNLSELKEKMNEIIDVPFEALIKEINSTRLEMAASFNSSILPVPSLSSLAADDANNISNDLCTGLDTSLIDDTANALHKLSNVAISLTFLLLFAIWATLAFWQWQKWKAMRSAVEAIEEEWQREGFSDPQRVIAIIEHPMLEKYSGRFLGKITKNKNTRMNLRWLMSYLAHPTCLALFFIALLGFLSIHFQLLALNRIKSHTQANANATITASAASLATKLNAVALNSSQEYANSYNMAIAKYEKKINEQLFGHWINTTAVTLNSTLVEFYNEVEKVVSATFGGTILFNPFNTFMYCILGSKINNLEKGLTWISEHASVTLPTLPSDILLLSKNSMNEITTPIVAAAVGTDSSNGNDGGAVGTLINHFESALKVERTFYGVMLCAWLVLLIIGLAVVIWNSGNNEQMMHWRDILFAKFINTSERENRQKWKVWSEKSWATKTAKNAHSYEDDPFNNYVSNIRNKEEHYLRVRDSQSDILHSPSSIKTFQGTSASLVAPDRNCFKTSGNSRIATPVSDDDDNRPFAMEQSSETHTLHNGNPPLSRCSDIRDIGQTNSPIPFWVDRFYGAYEGVKSFFPSRGQLHGAAVRRKASQSSETSFGASRVPTARSPGADWANYPPFGQSKNSRSWVVSDPNNIGRAIGGDDEQDAKITDEQKPHQVYPRCLSRASTLCEGIPVPMTDPPGSCHDISTTPLQIKSIQHNSIGYSEDYSWIQPDRYPGDDLHCARISTSPASSATASFCAYDSQVASAAIIKVGVDYGVKNTTVPMAEVLRDRLNNLQQRGLQSQMHQV